MIIQGFTAQGKTGKPKSTAKAWIGHGSMGIRQPDNQLELGSEFLARRKGEPLPIPAQPMKSVTLDNGEFRVTLTWDEILAVYEFASRKRENELRLKFNKSLDKGNAGS